TKQCDRREIGDESSLADAGLAGNDRALRFAGLRLLERLEQSRHFRLSADEPRRTHASPERVDAIPAGDAKQGTGRVLTATTPQDGRARRKIARLWADLGDVPIQQLQGGRLRSADREQLRERKRGALVPRVQAETGPRSAFGRLPSSGAHGFVDLGEHPT